jgi:hypothetical protein
MIRSGGHDGAVLVAIGKAAVIFAPVHFSGMAAKYGPTM